MPNYYPPPHEREKIERWVSAWRPWAQALAVGLSGVLFFAMLWKSFELIDKLQ